MCVERGCAWCARCARVCGVCCVVAAALVVVVVAVAVTLKSFSPRGIGPAVICRKAQRTWLGATMLLAIGPAVICHKAYVST